MRFSNSYVVAFAFVMCLVCAFFVSAMAVSLKERQDINELVEQKVNVLRVAGLVEPGEKASQEEVFRMFDEFVKPVVISRETGEVTEDIDATEYDPLKALKDPEASETAPKNSAQVTRLPKYLKAYKFETDGHAGLILPIHGKGLWSTLYGFISLADDYNTIQGITYYSHGETPGLGGEVDNPMWKEKWKGKIAFKDGEVAIHVVKGAASDDYSVDGLSGATITSNGVTNMLTLWLGEMGYGKYLDRLRDSAQAS